MTHVLVIDNNPFDRMLLADVLRASKSEMTVATAPHGYRCLDRYQEHHPDLVIAEIRKQEVEGIDTILTFRELDHEMPVLLTSSGLPVLLASHGLAIAVLDASTTTSSAVRGRSLLSAVKTCLSRSAAATHQPSAAN